MAIVIKEIEVKTTVEKKIILESEISSSIYAKIVNDVVFELSQNRPKQVNTNKRER